MLSAHALSANVTLATPVIEYACPVISPFGRDLSTSLAGV